MERLVGDRGPEVELIATLLASEALEEMPRDMDREAGLPARAAGAERTLAAPLITAALKRFPVENLEHAANRSLCSNRGVIESAHEAESPDLPFLANGFLPFCLAFFSAR